MSLFSIDAYYICSGNVIKVEMTGNNRSSSKDKTSYLFNRYMWLMDVIYRKKEISFKEIDELWQNSSQNLTGEPLPLRTFHNHRIAVQEMFNINILCDKGNGNKYYIESMENMEEDYIRNWMLNSFSLKSFMGESSDIRDRVLFENVPSGQTFLMIIMEAMKDNRMLEVVYQSFRKDRSQVYSVSPYCMKLFKQRWYLVGYVNQKDKVIILSLDRVKDIKISYQYFKMPENFSPEAYFRNSFGIIVNDGTAVKDVLLKVCQDQKCYFEALPLHPTQRILEETDEYTVFSYRIKPTYDFIQELLSHGSTVEVLQPESLRERMIEIIQKQCLNYQIS